MSPLLQDLPELPCDFTPLRAWSRQDECTALAALLPPLRDDAPSAGAVAGLAGQLVVAARAGKPSAFNDFLATWQLSSDEGRALLTLAEALLRIPDSESAHRLINDQLTRGNWLTRTAHESGLFVHLAGLGMALGKRFIREEENLPGRWHQLLLKMGDAVFLRAIQAALQLMANQFVQGEDMAAALARRQPGRRYSFDRLGEAAQTADDARRYTQDYRDAIEAPNA